MTTGVGAQTPYSTGRVRKSDEEVEDKVEEKKDEENGKEVEVAAE